MEEMIELYTCETGIDLWKNGNNFWAWTEEERQAEAEYDDIESDIKFLVNKKYILNDALLISSDAELIFEY